MTFKRFYRIAHTTYRYDLSGKGAELLGGRFNTAGTSAVYAASTISLAALEILVHGADVCPDTHFVMAIEVPAQAMEQVETITLDDLPKGWRSTKDMSACRSYGMKRIFNVNRFAALVPSVIIPDEYNIVLNPAHPAMRQVSITELRPFDLDERLKNRMK